MIFIKWWHRGVCRCAGGTRGGSRLAPPAPWGRAHDKHLQEMSSGLKSVY